MQDLDQLNEKPRIVEAERLGRPSEEKVGSPLTLTVNLLLGDLGGKVTG